MGTHAQPKQTGCVPSTAQPAFEVFGVDAAEYQHVYLKAVSGSDCYGELLAEWYGSMCLRMLNFQIAGAFQVG